MQKIKLAVCMEDAEYQERFINYLFEHYGERFELHGYASLQQFKEHSTHSGEQILIIDEPLEQKSFDWEGTIICLAEENQNDGGKSEEKIHRVEKYQDAGRIVDEILGSTQEVYGDNRDGASFENMQLLAVYSLADTEYQLPFTLTLASILGEAKRTLVLDLQENSGLQQLFENQEAEGVEELMVMAQGGKITKNRLLSCICHQENWDYVYPAKDTECICGMEPETYFNILRLLGSKTDYEVLLVNFGCRFPFFFQALEKSQAVFFLKKQSGLSQGRELEFERELHRKGCQEIGDKMIKMEMPTHLSQAIPCERLVDEWKWNEFGDRIRKLLLGVTQLG